LQLHPNSSTSKDKNYDLNKSQQKKSFTALIKLQVKFFAKP